MKTRKKSVTTASSASAGKPAFAAPQTSTALSEGDAQAAWQVAHDALQLAFDHGSALVSTLHDKDQIAVLNATLDTLSDELTALDQEDIHNHTVSLKAATQQLGAGIARLKDLQQQLVKIADAITDAAKVIAAIDGVISGLESLLKTFPL